MEWTTWLRDYSTDFVRMKSGVVGSMRKTNE